MALAFSLSGCARSAPALPSAPPTSSAVATLRSDLATFLSRQGHRRTTWGVVVESLASGDRLFEMNPGTLLVPASAAKILTAATASAAVGWDYTFETTASVTGQIDGGVLRGDLVITGTGDPSLEGRGGTSFFPALIAALRDRQITQIEGRVIGNDNLVEEPRPGLAWSWDDLRTATGAIAGALNVGENITRITIYPGFAPGASASVHFPPDAPELSIINRSATTAPDTPLTLWAEQRPEESGLTIAGTIAAGSMPFRMPVAVGNPTLWFARLVRTRLIGAGIAVAGDAADIDDLTPPPAAGTSVLGHRSRPLSEIVMPMMKDSINMYADAVVRLATGPSGTRVMADAVAAERRQLQAWGVAEDAVRVVDGSGLSRFNVVTAEALVAVLKQMYQGGAASPFVQSLPIAGVDGSIENRMKNTPAADNARAKTGSMTNVRSLAGYVTTRDGETLAFAIIANNFEGPPPAVLSAIDQIVVRLASFSRR